MTTTTLLAILLFVAAPAAAQLADLDAGELADGERLFRVHCARCHGMNGAGGEGSNLARARLKYATDDEKLLDILGEGIPGTGMPAIWSLDDEQAKRGAGYVRSLGRIEEEAMPGPRFLDTGMRHRENSRPVSGDVAQLVRAADS